MSPFIYLQIEQFILQLQHQQISFSLFGFLEINLTFILGVRILRNCIILKLHCFLWLFIPDYWRDGDIPDNFNSIFSLNFIVQSEKTLNMRIELNWNHYDMHITKISQQINFITCFGLSQSFLHQNTWNEL